jgi:hypothetical protein
MSMGSRFITGICVIALSLAFFLGFHLGRGYDQPTPGVMTAHPMAKQADGSLVLARQPEALKPQQQIPAGDSVINVVKLTVRPKPYEPAAQHEPRPDSHIAQSSNTAPALCSCAPITVDMSLVRDKVGAEDVVASSLDGQILGGISSPVLPPVALPDHPWAMGVSYGAGAQSGRLGVTVDRKLGPVVVGGDVYTVNGALAARLHALFRF